MMLMTYGAEQRAAGKYIGKVELIRKWISKQKRMPVEDAADAFDVSVSQVEGVLSLIKEHPDWDAGKIADQVDWRK